MNPCLMNVGRVRLARIAWVGLVLALALVLTVVLLLRKPEGFSWKDGTYSLRLQRFAPGAFAGEGWWIRTGWDGPTGEFTHGELYGLKLGKMFLRLDINYDPVAKIKSRLPKTVPGLLGMLHSKDSLEERCAGDALVAMGPAALSAFPEMLKRQEQGDETMAPLIIELSKTTRAEAVPLLVPALGNRVAEVRRNTAEALGEIGSEGTAAVPALTKALRDPAPIVVMMSALSLRKIERKDHGEIAALTGLFNNGDPEVRNAAVLAVGEFGADAEQAVQPLIHLLENGHADPGFIGKTLGAIGPAAKPAIPRLVQLLWTENDQGLHFIMEALGRFGKEANAGIPKLLQLAERQETMWGAISALGSMGPDAVPGLVQLYKQRQQHFWAAKALIKLGPEAAAAVPAFLEALQSESASDLALAAMALGCLGENARVALPQLTELTRDEDPRVRIRAAEALWKLDRQTDAVLAVMIEELEEWSKDPNALRQETTDSFGECRQQIAAQILGEIGPAAQEAVPLLQMMLRSSFANQKASAARALERIEATRPDLSGAKQG